MMKKILFLSAAVCAALSFAAVASAQPPPKKDGDRPAPPPRMERPVPPDALSPEAQKQIKEHSDAIRAIMDAERARLKAEWKEAKDLVDAYRKDPTNEEAKAKLAKAIGDKYDAEMARRQEAVDAQKAAKDDFVNKQLEFIAKGDKKMGPPPPPPAGDRKAPQVRDGKAPRWGWGRGYGCWDRGPRHGWDRGDCWSRGPRHGWDRGDCWDRGPRHGWGHRGNRAWNCPNGDWNCPGPQGCVAPASEEAPAPAPEAPAEPAE